MITLPVVLVAVMYVALPTAGYMTAAMLRSASAEDAYNAGYLDGIQHQKKKEQK